LSTPDLIPVISANGIFLPELSMHLDGHKKCAFSFVSHAHADHFAKHQHIVCSTRTADIIEIRYGFGKSKVTRLEFGEEMEIDGHKLRLLPAGHILGSAQIHITRMSDNATLLYTGDFKMRTGLSSETPEFAQADTLIMETTFGEPHYIFPPADDILKKVVAFSQDALKAGDTPILLGYSLGKAQEILAALKGAKLSILVHPAVDDMTRVYQRHFPEKFPDYEVQTEDSDITGKVLVFPPNTTKGKFIQSIEKRKLAMLSGWGINPRAKYMYRSSEVFLLSDHADYPGLLECVAAVNPRKVLTVHGSTAKFAADLRRRGIEAWSFETDDQLELDLR
jgi:DNA ligase-1